jgi:hypothetical protein
MKKFKCCILIALPLVLNAFIANAQDSVRYIRANDTTIGIPIKKAEFDKKVSTYIKLMGDWTTFKPNDYIEMIRLYNTIGDSYLLKVDYYRMYYEIFLVMYLKRAAQSLDAKLSKGMAMYSKKYNLWIGDEPLGNDISRFKIDSAK